MLKKEAVGYAIREIRTGKGLMGVTVASLAYVAVGHLNNVEHGKREISSELLERVASAMGVTVGDILVRAGRVMNELDAITGGLDNRTTVV